MGFKSMRSRVKELWELNENYQFVTSQVRPLRAVIAVPIVATATAIAFVANTQSVNLRQAAEVVWDLGCAQWRGVLALLPLLVLLRSVGGGPLIYFRRKWTRIALAILVYGPAVMMALAPLGVSWVDGGFVKAGLSRMVFDRPVEQGPYALSLVIAWVLAGIPAKLIELRGSSMMHQELTSNWARDLSYVSWVLRQARRPFGRRLLRRRNEPPPTIADLQRGFRPSSPPPPEPVSMDEMFGGFGGPPQQV